MRCHYTYDPVAGKVHIPGCWGAVVYGPSFCTCYNRRAEEAESEKVKDLSRQLQDCERYNAQLQRIIKRLTNQK
jgi:hypothetical protein